ncbi:MAG: DNA replication/repair protein RecF [Maricaulis sp.]|nr:DNA replication/repair protein RecF [Maricaulis sp.]HAQ36071.1 DNA replication/repair protein RecF [Alphaproteobacteria bacterium]
MDRATRLLRLRLTDFRGYAALDVDPGPAANVFFGPNGAGKTNILEAISFLAPGKGLRGAETEDVMRHDADSRAAAWAVYAEGEGADGPLTLAAGAREGQRRETRLDGSPATRAALARSFPMIALQPEEDRLFAGPRSERLKFLDKLIAASHPGHGEALLAYDKLRSRRQRLLDEGRADPAWLDALEGDMAGHGVAIAASRLDALARLQAEIDAAPESAFPKAELALEGETEGDLARGLLAGEAEDALKDRLFDGRRRDGASGRTLSKGPHRTDLTARHRAKDRPAGECSTGEQKALVVRLALSHAAVLERTLGSVPLLLLDEACAHLDADRRAGLAGALSDLGAQSYLTGVERGLFDAFGGETRFFSVASATVKAA